MNRIIIAFVLFTLCNCNQSRADLVLTAIESGGNVVIESDGGSLNLSALTKLFATPTSRFVNPGNGTFAFGNDPGGTDADRYSGGIIGPSNFGVGASTSQSGESGDYFVGIFSNSVLHVPIGMQSGESMSFTSIFAATSFDDLGMDRGTYVWSWGSGATADSVKLIVVPEPATCAIPCLVAVMGVTIRRRRPQVTQSLKK